MQADYALCRDIMRACHDRYPQRIYFHDLLDGLPGRTAPDVEYHVLILEDHGSLQVDKTTVRTYDGTTTEVDRVRLSNLDVAKQFLNPPEPESEPPRRPIGFRR